MIPFNAELIEAFSGTFLSPMYDNPCPTPQFHREGWKLYASDAPLAAVIAPRGHAKSTAFTHDFALASALFRQEPHIMIVSATEKLSLSHLADISRELHDNDELVEEFGIKEYPTDAKEEIIVRLNDGYEFRILARGAGQKLRGTKWKGRRPGLVICDDMEEDEQVASKDRRDAFSAWVLRALIPMRRKGGRIRWHGTLLHVDAFLAKIRRAQSWKCLFYRAHAGFDDFSDILWPEQFGEKELREIRQIFLDDPDSGGSVGYSQEYLNNPMDEENAYLRREWFLPMEDGDFTSQKLICAAADFAISKKDRANRTSLTIAGKDQQNILNFLDQRVGRWDSLEIVEEIFAIQAQWHPDCFFVEHGQIWLSLWPLIRQEMQRRGIYINFIERKPIGDKASRGRSLQRRMRAGATRWAAEAHWFEGMRDEMLRFTGFSEATLDDQFDSSALLSLGFEDLSDVESEDFASNDDNFLRREDPRQAAGRNETTGY